MVMLDRRQQSLLFVSVLIKVCVIELMLWIFGRICFIDMPQQPGFRPNISVIQIFEFCCQVFDALRTFFLPDCLIVF